MGVDGELDIVGKSVIVKGEFSSIIEKGKFVDGKVEKPMDGSEVGKPVKGSDSDDCKFCEC